MQLSSFLTALTVAATVALACPDDDHGHDHAHEHSKRANPSSPLTPPSRPLVWGDFNVIHTTDTHGWLLGHQKPSFPEPNFSGDLGDFYSFVEHMKQIALEKDVDLLLVDSGDLHDGTGLSDGYPPGGVDAHDSNKFLLELPYDLMTVGNHELYDYINAYDMYTNFVPHLNGRYLSSNVNITIFDKKGEAASVPLGERFVKFKSRKGRSITSLGVLFDFTGNDHNTTVQPVEDMVKEQWFAEAIAEEPDLFLLVGHMPVSEDHWPDVFNAIRAVHKTTPILIFGGHSHIRDCVQLDGRSMSLESGRYMETIGWMSADFSVPSHQNISFSRRYLDQNRITYEYHTNKKHNITFDTLKGKSITEGMQQLANEFDLSFQYGVAPEDYTLSRNPYPSNGSVLTLFVSEALPYSLTVNNSRANIPNLMITNSGELRFDLYKGPFNKNDQLTSLPFTDAFLYIPNITLSVATQVLPVMNHAGAPDKRRSLERLERELELYSRGDVSMRFNRWLEAQDRLYGVERRNAANLTLGYVTQDSCPGVGDDTLHEAMPFFDSPDYIQSNPPNVTADTPIDLVFINFIESDVLDALNQVQSEKKYTEDDALSYTDILASAVLGIYAQGNWN